MAETISTISLKNKNMLWHLNEEFFRARFGSTYTKIGTIQRRLAWPLRKDDTQIHEAFHIFTREPTLLLKRFWMLKKKKKNFSFWVNFQCRSTCWISKVTPWTVSWKTACKRWFLGKKMAKRVEGLFTIWIRFIEVSEKSHSKVAF